MEEKQMTIADLNVVFGKEEEPLLKIMDDIVLPALQSGIIRPASENTRFLFEDCQIVEMNGELVLKGIIIKDTILDVMSEYTEAGLRKTDKHFPSSPYSIFMIFLKNHRMVIVKNQSGSPDIRSFKTSFKYILGEYALRINKERKEKNMELLPYAKVTATGIKTSESVKKVLEDVEKITELSFRFYLLNSEWDYDPIFGGIDEAIRKVIRSKGGRMVFPSPQSKDGVADVIEKTEGLVKTKMKVKYKDDSEKGSSKRTGIIKDNEISSVNDIEVSGELDEAFDEIMSYKKGFKSLNVESQNNIILYDEYRKKKNW